MQKGLLAKKIGMLSVWSDAGEQVAVTALPRQQTLRALIDWSYDLLTDLEKLLLRRLAVFSGGWTLELAEQICSDEKLDALDILDMLGHLVDKSLVAIEVKKDGNE